MLMVTNGIKVKPEFEQSRAHDVSKLIGTNARKFTGTPPVLVYFFQRKLWNVYTLAEVLAGN